MKLAIQGHPFRGKEVIQILESLGGKNTEKLEGTYTTFYYIDDKGEIGDNHKQNFPSTYKLYTLDEFESEFPFRIGDIVALNGINKPHKIVALELYMNKLCYKLDNGLHFIPRALTTYEKMKEERNITLTLDKAKEWYKKGGELKEIALQAFTEKELNPLPKTWEEFCSSINKIHTEDIDIPLTYKTSRKLEILRDIYRQGWKPNWLDGNEIKYTIKGWRDKSSIETTYVTHAFLSFPTYDLAFEFQECFKDLIEQAGDLI